MTKPTNIIYTYIRNMQKQPSTMPGMEMDDVSDAALLPCIGLNNYAAGLSYCTSLFSSYHHYPVTHAFRYIIKEEDVRKANGGGFKETA